jgi:hypothetical protein
MARIITQTTAMLLVITLIIGFFSTSSVINASSAIIKQEEEQYIIIDQVNVDVKLEDEYVPLAEMIEEGLNPEEGDVVPRIANGSSLHINATYSIIPGQDESVVIHKFAIEVYPVVSGEETNLTLIAGIVSYEYSPIETFILNPNSSKSEVISIESLRLPELGTYKFVFRLSFHIHKGSTVEKSVLFNQNMTFELITGYPSPPYIIIFLFYFFLFVFIAIIIFGLYGSRKYKVE